MTPCPGSKRTEPISLEQAVNRRNKNNSGITNRRDCVRIAQLCGVSAEKVRQFLKGNGYELSKTIGGMALWKKQKRQTLSRRSTNLYKLKK